MGRLSARVNDVQNTAEDAGVAVPIPGPKPMAEGSGNYGGGAGVEPEPREPIPGVTEPRDDARR